MSFAADYFADGYEIVQLAWNYAWQLTDVHGYPAVPGPANIQYAACRPATFLKYVHDNFFTSGNGMCAQGTSAGSAAVAYSLAYYGLGAQLDNVELLSGPVLSDIRKGCEVTNFPPVTVCGQNGGSQTGCKLGSGGSTWALSPAYLSPAVNGVRSWTADSTCNGTANTSPSSNLAWYQASIVDDGTNGPTFSYPNIAMSGWLCRIPYTVN